MHDKLTFNECKTAHREMWLWLAENPIKRKMDWPKFETNIYLTTFNGHDIPHGCFACYWVTSFKRRNCILCPITWVDETQKVIIDGCAGCETKGTLYYEWKEFSSSLRYMRSGEFTTKKAKELEFQVSSFATKLADVIWINRTKKPQS